MTIEPLTGVQNPQPYLDLVKEEYKTLRDESKQASINMLAAIQIGATVIGALMYAGFSQWNSSPAVVVFVFFLIVPILGAVSLFVWLGEAIRMRRVGDYLVLIEHKASFAIQRADLFPFTEAEWSPIQQKIERGLAFTQRYRSQIDPLKWEQWLRESRATGFRALLGEPVGHQTVIYFFRLTLFPALIFASRVIAQNYAQSPPIVIPQNVRDWLTMIRWTSNFVVAATFIFTAVFALQLRKTPNLSNVTRSNSD